MERPVFFFLLACQSSGAFVGTMVRSFANFLIKVEWSGINMFFHGCYAISFMVCNQSFLTLGVHGQDLKINKINMAKYFHDLVMIEIHGLVVIHL